ncbi:FctA domain-containing protein, partial [Streptococcus parasanguinis]|uniref:Spy0128 family protein n=1 Tax=Streptococcus parasanguinis TaxID=1318 RepID=UPI001E5ADD94
MKDIFNRRQRFSLRKYSIGVCSVLLGTALFAAGAQSASADEAKAASGPAETATSETQPAATESSQTEAPGASKAYGEGASVPKIDRSGTAAANSETPAPATEKAEVAETPAATENKEAKAEEAAKPAKAETKKSEEAPKTTASSETSKPVEKKKESSSKPASTTAATTAQPTATSAAAGESSERAAAREEAATPAGTTTFSATVSSAAPITGTEAAAQSDRVASTNAAVAVANANEERTNAGALAVSSRRRGKRALTDHNVTPIDVVTTIASNVSANPDMTDPNGASVHSQTIPAGYQAKEGDFYTFGIWNLTKFNARYNTNYYARAYKNFDSSTDTTVELIDKNTGAVVETHTVTATSGVQKFTTTTPKSNNELTLQVDYQAGAGQGPGKTDQPFIQMGFEVGPAIQALVAAGHNLTPAEQARFDAVYDARNSNDILNAVEPTYNGRQVTDTNFKIPANVEKTTYYKLVDKKNPTYKETGKSVTTQDYKENGNETELAKYTLKAMEGQKFTASGERQFTKQTEDLGNGITKETVYKLYQTVDPDTTSGYVSRPYTVGTKFMDAERAGIKRIKEIVGEDGSVVVRVYLLDPKQQSKRSDGTLNTDGYMLLAETKPIKPGEANTEELVVKKTPLTTIAHTVTDPKTGAKTNYPNGKTVPFDFQWAAGYTPYKTVFVPFLGDNIGHLSPNSQLERGVGGIGTNVDLLNSLTPYKQPIYYYDKTETIKVKPEVEKQLEGRVLVDGEFSFKIKENSSSPGVEETVTNKNGKASFSELSFKKEGTYTYTITEVKGADKDVDYDAMEVTMTVKVTKDANGDLQASVKYTGEGGFKSSADDKIFNNYVVAPVKTRFDFSKALAGRELKEGEFSFVLKDSTGKTLQTKTNTKQGVVAFDDLTFDNTQVGTHKYTVEEVQGSEAGMTYDPMKAEVTITVTKEGHVLKATNTLPADREFNNTFTPVATQAQFKFTKKLEGKELTKDAFTFELLENGNVIQTKQNAADGTIQFDAISYAAAGTHTYTVREKAGTDTNIDYDPMNAVVTVNVTKDAQTGLLNAAVTMPADTEFNNFAVAPVKTRFDFSKALAGRELKEGEFTFVLKDANGKTLQTKTNTKQGVVAFDNLTFDNTQVGVHKYTVEEVQGSEAGMTYDPMKAEVTITVTKEGHVLKATNALPADTEFNNTFTPAATQAQFKFTKRLEGKELTKDAFTFELLENGNVIQTKKNAADGSITFDAIEYNAVGEHTYTVREVAGADTNIDYDSMNAVVTVNVTKNAATGILSAAVTMPEDTEFNNYVVSPVVTKFDFTKKLAGRKLAAGEFSFVLKDAAGNKVETVKNDADGNVTFSELSFDNTKVGTHTYTVEEVIPANKEFGMTYDQMKATVTVEVAKNGHSLTTVTNVTSTGGKDANGNATDGTPDKEFNNKVTPPETPKFQPEKFVVSKEKYDITGNKLMDDDDELTNEYTETNADPYVDKTTNNEPENLNTKTVKRGSKLVYQVWLDTTKFTEANNIQYVGVSDTYDADKLDVNAADIKAYDSVTGAEVTNKFDIKVENGTITATSKDEFIKDKVNAPVIDTTKFEFGRYYKFDIPATVKESVKAGADIENTANQTVHVYNPVSKTVEKPEKPTQKRVNSVPVPVEMNFTKRLEGRELQKNEFEFVLKKDGVEVERVKNDAAGKIVFKTLEFGRDDLGKTYNYTVEETPGTDATVKYDTMVATVKVVVSHDGTAKAIVANVTDAADKEFNNRVTPPEEPKFQPEKYVVSKEKYDITGDKLVDDDRELADKYADTNANPYADDASNNEAENLNTKTVERGSKLVYQVWLDTTKFDAANKDNIQTVGISDNYDEAKLNLNKADIKAYDSVTGAEVTDKFDIAVNNGVITANLKAGFTKSLGDAENTQVIDTTKFAFGRYYKFDIPTTVKDDVVAGADIENTAAQVVNYYNPTTKKVEKPERPTEKRVNNVPISVEFNFTKKLEGRELKANEFTFELKDSDNVVIATATNDADGNFKFTPVDYTNKAGKTVTALKYQKGQEGTYTYTVTEVKGTDSTVAYDPMAAVVTVKVSHDGTAKALITNVTEPADKEFNNKVTPPEEPKFQPEKYVVSKAKFDITGTKLVDDDSELTDKYGETNTNPYVDNTNNNEAENLNTKTVERGSKLYYQVWLDTTKFDAANKDNIQTVGITDNYDKDKLTVNASDIKVYDSVTGADVTTKFDISDNNGVLTANLKAGFTKSLGDTENTQIIDTTKFEFGRYYKFDIPATVKDDVVAGADIENKAAQVVNYYNPVSKKVEKPNKPTEKRVNSVPVPLDLKFTKSLEGRQLKDQEFTFVLKKDGNVVETVKNDATGKVNFTQLKFGKDDLGKTYNYTVEEVRGTDSTVSYDPMVATVKVVVSHDGTAKAIVANVTDAADKEFNNRVTPPEEPKFQPEKYVLNAEKFSITDNKLLDDDSELADKYADTNANPYVDGTANNEAENINTKTVKRGDKLVYQVWLDTTKFDAANKDNIQSVGISDDYDEAKLDLDSTKIKAYDSVTGAEVTDKFDIAVNNGVITATLKDGFTKSLGDAENTQVIDTTKFAFGRYYKFDIPTTVKQTVKAGVDIENTAAQVVNYYNPTTKKVEKPSKPTEKRVNNVPVEVEFNFTKRLEGRELKANEFSFVLKDSTGKEVETVSNDASGNVKFKALEFKKGQEGV